MEDTNARNARTTSVQIVTSSCMMQFIVAPGVEDEVKVRSFGSKFDYCSSLLMK